MKKYIFLLFIFCLQLVPAKAQWVTIPDPYFATKLTQLFPSCMNGNLMDTTCSQIINANTLNLNNLYLTDLSGVEHFVNLTTLNCNNNQLTNLPSLPNTLVNLNCNYNDLISLPALPDSLKELRCRSNYPLSNLPTLPSSLQYLDCSYNWINNLPALPASLQTLNCESQSTQLTALPALPNSLTDLNCRSNALTTLTTLPNSLQHLTCDYCLLTSLPSLPASLLTLYCSQNQLTSLPALPSSLTSISCWSNQLSGLPPLPNTLYYLDCSDNQLTSLPSLPNSLNNLNCSQNQLTSLPSFPNSLKNLNCNQNLLSNLSPLPITMTNLQCSDNFLSNTFILPDSLLNFGCAANQFTSLPVLPDSLLTLGCDNNQLTSLPAILPSTLAQLSCANCQLSSLPLLPSSLTWLNCSNNQLTSIPPVPEVMDEFNISTNNILCLSNLPNYSFFAILLSTIFEISNNPLTCVPNQTSYSLGLPLCMDNDPVNNPNYCTGVANITGSVFGDLNSSCNYDTSDLQTDNIPVKVFDSQNNFLAMSYTVNGMYSFTLLQPDTFYIKVDDNLLPISMDCGQPNNQSVTLDSANQTILDIDFPVVCDTINDIKIQSVIPLGLVFPGQVHTINTDIALNQNWYNLNCVSTNFSGTVIIEVTGPVTYSSPATNALIPIVTGNTFTYNITDFNNTNPLSFGLQFTTDTTAQLGDQVCVHVEILPSPLDADTTNNIYDFCYSVINSYDPNMKEVYPVNVLPGYDDWFTYTIHFQNTGNAPAFNIRLRDTLDANLDINTFEIRGYSHPAIVSINGNILTVRFNNIMLPDSTTDYEGSMGYFQYRIKPLPNLPLGTQIENTAYIYFDYNAPIITNTTQNNFQTVVSTFNKNEDANQLKVFPNPANEVLNINLQNNIIKNCIITNALGQTVYNSANEINTNQKIQLNISNLKAGVYFVKVRASNGSYNAKFIKAE